MKAESMSKRSIVGIVALVLGMALCFGLLGCSSGSSSSDSGSSGSSEGAVSEEEAQDSGVYVMTENKSTYGDYSYTYKYDRDENGNTKTYESYTDDKLTTSISYKYDEYGNITSLTTTRYDEDGNDLGSNETTYDIKLNSDNLVEKASAKTKEFEYSDGGTNPAGEIELTYKYSDGMLSEYSQMNTSETDQQKNVNIGISKWNEFGFMTSYEQKHEYYGADGKLDESTWEDSEGNEHPMSYDYVYTYAYEGDGENPASATIKFEKDKGTVSFEYDENGNLSTVKDSKGNVLNEYKWELIENPSISVIANARNVGGWQGIINVS